MESGGATVVPQQAAQPLAAMNRTIHLTDGRFRDNQAVFESLVISFGVIVLNKRRYRVTELFLAEEDDPLQALGISHHRQSRWYEEGP